MIYALISAALLYITSIPIIFALLLLNELKHQRAFTTHTLEQVKLIAQTILIHAKSRTTDEAVVSQSYLEQEQLTLEKSEDLVENEPVRVPKGFRGVDNKIYTFASPPNSKLLANIPKERLIYESNV